MFSEMNMENEEVKQWFNDYNTNIVGLKRNFLWMMTAVAAAGKTTFIEKRLWRPNTEIISTDNIIENIAKVCATTYSDIFDKVSKFVGTYSLNMVRQAVRDKKDIIWDQTNLTKLSRKRKLDMIPETYHKISVYIETPSWEELKRRNHIRAQVGKNIPDNILKNMCNQLELPNHTEGFDEIWYVFQDGIINHVV